MARYKRIDMSPRLLPVVLEEQLVPGSFAHAVHHLVDQLDLSRFDSHYRNDKVGSCAYAPSILLKAVLLAYSQGIISSRGIERACRDNVVFVAITPSRTLRPLLILSRARAMRLHLCLRRCWWCWTTKN
jgi:transposase